MSISTESLTVKSKHRKGCFRSLFSHFGTRRRQEKTVDVKLPVLTIQQASCSSQPQKTPKRRAIRQYSEGTMHTNSSGSRHPSGRQLGVIASNDHLDIINGSPVARR